MAELKVLALRAAIAFVVLFIPLLIYHLLRKK